MTEIKFFNRWSTEKIQVNDPGLREYINLKPILVPKTSGRYNKQFSKSRVSIVERLMNKLMVPGHRGKKHKIGSGHLTGKSNNAAKIIEKTLEILEKKTNENPIKVLVQAIENAAPREEITTIEYGGARYPQAVDCSPGRRLDLALKQIVHGAYNRSFNKKKNIIDALVDEIMKAYNIDTTSNAIAKKLELERQADSSR